MKRENRTQMREWRTKEERRTPGRANAEPRTRDCRAMDVGEENAGRGAKRNG